MPKDWNRYFADTRNGMSKYLKKYNMELLASSQELAAFEAQALDILDHPADKAYSVSPEKSQSYIDGSSLTFYKSVYQREVRSSKEYDTVFDFMTIKDGYILEFCGYHVDDTPERASSDIRVLEKRMNALANGMTIGNTTSLYKDAAGNSWSDKIKSFLKKRLPGVVIPFYVCIFIFYIVGLLTGKHYGLTESIGYLTGFIWWYLFYFLPFFTALPYTCFQITAIGQKMHQATAMQTSL